MADLGALCAGPLLVLPPLLGTAVGLATWIVLTLTVEVTTKTVVIHKYSLIGYPDLIPEQ